MRSRISVVTMIIGCCATLFAQAPVSAQIAQATAKPTGPVVDVALGVAGRLTGQVLDAQGDVVPRAVVSIRFGDAEIARCVSDERGRYAVTNLRGGLHHIVCNGGETVFRLWSPQTAPPSALTIGMVVSQRRVVRGQVIDGLNLVNGAALGLGTAGLVVAVSNSGEIDDLKDDYKAASADTVASGS